ncbi:MAG: hypothetical protein KC931_14660 [Candidatus Omnitrophica bacterium]|nr:hypothetical protein [Candidatus Omnitrophota bacterium]MCA9440994.1 hypothetical protein [Candidatus Omnitrophota bacterium]MCA9448359.1 hypothetical protein [Candidatus Omnitrophota bacterium]MCB9783096.1 hypothetical protein [Candidatus Omnitrophota bacterium]
MLRRIATEAAIRIGSDGAEWLVWGTRSETLTTGRMTASYSVDAALDQWLGRAARFGMRPKRIWLIAGAAECAHRRIVLPGTNQSMIAQALAFSVEEELPLPLDQMWWTYSTRLSEDKTSTVIDVVATPRALFEPWLAALGERKQECAGRLPEGPLLWSELAAIRGSEIDLLSVWGERRATIIRGDEQGMNNLAAFVRGPGESWEALSPELSRPFKSHQGDKSVISVFTSERLRKRVTSLPDLLPEDSQNLLNHEIFHGVGEDVTVAVSLLAMRRARMERRQPQIAFSESPDAKPAADFRPATPKIDIPSGAYGVAAMALVCLVLFFYSLRSSRQYAEAMEDKLSVMESSYPVIQERIKALDDFSEVRYDWGSVWLQMSELIPKETLFKEFSYSSGGGVRLIGTTENQKALEELVKILDDLDYLNNVRILKTAPADKKLTFTILADFDGDEVEYYEVGDQKPKEEEKAEKKSEKSSPKKKSKEVSLLHIGGRLG